MTVLEPHSVVRPSVAPAPVAAARSSYIAAFLALLLVGAGGLALRDAAVAAGALRGEPLIPNGFDAIAQIAPQQWMLPAGVVVGMLGVALVVVALLPRRSTAVGVDADTAVYVRHRDVATVATAAALDVPGVLAASSSASTGRVAVRCSITGDADEARALIADALGRALEPLQRKPRIAVRIRQEKLS